LLLGPHRSLSTKALWKRKITNSTINLKRKCVMTSDQNNNERDRKKPIQINNTNTNNTNNNNGKKLRLNNDSSTTQSDETTYCLCSQVRDKKSKIFI